MTEKHDELQGAPVERWVRWQGGLMRLPTFEEAEAASHTDANTPLTDFIYCQEPAGIEDQEQFRSQLEALIKYVQLKEATDGDK